MFHAIYVGATSACFELENQSPYLAPEPWRALLDGAPVAERYIRLVDDGQVHEAVFPPRRDGMAKSASLYDSLARPAE